MRAPCCFGLDGAGAEVAEQAAGAGVGGVRVGDAAVFAGGFEEGSRVFGGGGHAVALSRVER